MYDATPLYERNPLDGLESGIGAVSRTRFGHDRHESVENVIRSLRLAHSNPTRTTATGWTRVFVASPGNGRSVTPSQSRWTAGAKGGTRLEIVKGPLDSAEDLVHVDNVPIDREFDGQRVPESV